MADEKRGKLTLIQPGAISTENSARLNKLLETPTEIYAAGVRDETTGEFREEYRSRIGAWRAPATLTQGEKSAAREAFERLLEQLDAAQPAGVAKWVVKLAMLTRSRQDDTAAPRLEAYTDMLIARQYPVGVFTDVTLHQVVTRYRFFPAYAELAEMLDPIYQELTERLVRLDTLAHDVPVDETKA